MTQLTSLKIIATGKVQRVGYRAYLKKAAKQLNVVGYAKNRMDGSVEIIANAQPSVLDEFMLHVQRGSMNAEVTHVDWQRCEHQTFNEFSIS